MVNIKPKCEVLKRKTTSQALSEVRWIEVKKESASIKERAEGAGAEKYRMGDAL